MPADALDRWSEEGRDVEEDGDERDIEIEDVDEQDNDEQDDEKENSDEGENGPHVEEGAEGAVQVRSATFSENQVRSMAPFSLFSRPLFITITGQSP